MGLFDMFSSFLSPEKGYEKGQEQLDKYYQEGQGYLNPYNEYGKGAYGNLSEFMKKMLDPAALESEWVKGYSESPYAKNAESLAKEHGLDAASSLGLMGSNTALNAIQGGTTNIGLQDRQNYLNDLMQKYLSGANIASGIFNTGANAAGAMSNNAMNMGNNSAQMAYGQQNAPGDLFGKVLGTAIGAATGVPTGMSGYGGGNYNNRYNYPSNANWSLGGR